MTLIGGVFEINPMEAMMGAELSEEDVENIAINLIDYVGNLPMGLLIAEHDGSNAPALNYTNIQSQLFAYNIASVYLAMSRFTSPKMDIIAKRFTDLIRNSHLAFGCLSEDDLYNKIGVANDTVFKYINTYCDEDRGKSLAGSMKCGVEYFRSLGIETHNPISGFLASHHLGTHLNMVSNFLIECLELPNKKTIKKM
jgi:hypothetical protein